MNNLFSSFDPLTFFNLNWNWFSSLLIIFLYPFFFWILPSRWNFIYNFFYFFIYKEFKILIYNKNNILIFTSLFMLILINNFMGLFPYIFTSSSHMVFTLTFSIPLWMSFMIFGYLNNLFHMLAHMVPNSAPQPLLPFLVIIESTSNIIRPSTLAIRLTANMIAGHLLLTLLGNSCNKLPLIFLSSLFLIQMLLLTLESAVAIIQSYVFSILTTLYSSEV
uniref:ATP synthase subunit a n=1 Tax=Scolytinae sp. 6 ACP-2013 TaxID=1434579 RepID=A0A3G3ME87_9CUCU|nr:ATP synthase F0 subunit 6 [Scolytinae sp. 6 ACP-2013]